MLETSIFCIYAGYNRKIDDAVARWELTWPWEKGIETWYAKALSSALASTCSNKVPSYWEDNRFNVVEDEVLGLRGGPMQLPCQVSHPDDPSQKIKLGLRG